MDRTILGRTGLSVSVMGLGCGGHSRLGLATGNTEANAIAVVRTALDLGVNFIDTAEAYKTESVVGQALEGVRRDSVVISTKVSPKREGKLATKAEIKERAEACLQRLQTDHVDILHMHGVSAEDYAFVREEHVPALLELQKEGKIRFTGITEAFGPDPQHKMLTLALEDNCWDVMMVGFNILNPSARERVFPITQQKAIGVLDMFAVRRALQDAETLRNLVQSLIAQGQIDAGACDADAPLDFLLKEGIAESLPDAAYRFCRYEPGVHVALSGTGNIEHLTANAASLSRPPLPKEILARLKQIFGRVDTVSGN